MAELPGRPGFATPSDEKALSRQRAVELIATVGLTVSLVIAATAVSLGNRSLTRGEHAARSAVQTPDGALPDQAATFDQTAAWFSLGAQQ